MRTSHFGLNNSGFKSKLDKNKIVIISLLGFILILLIALALVLQSRSAIATKTSDSQTENVHAVIDTTTVTLFSPVSEVSPGTSLQDIELQEIMWPADSIPKGAVQDVAILTNKFAKRTLPYGEPILLSHLSEMPNESSIMIRKGMRAVTIEVSAKSSVEGWATPGSHVDVVLTHLDNGKLTSSVVVENARILSVGGESENQPKRSPRKKVKSSTTVTLELTPSDALKIETAQQLGTLSLHLRAPEDHRSGGIESVDQEDLSVNKGPDDNSPECKKGKMTIAGVEYWLDCSGKLIESAE